MLKLLFGVIAFGVKIFRDWMRSYRSVWKDQGHAGVKGRERGSESHLPLATVLGQDEVASHKLRTE